MNTTQQHEAIEELLSDAGFEAWLPKSVHRVIATGRITLADLDDLYVVYVAKLEEQLTLGV